jgi:phosphoribosylamine--glycine ligase
LVIGNGGREHALTWRLAASPSVDRVATAPGNPGTAELGPNLAVDATDLDAVADLAEREDIDLVVVGPEAPLVAGVVDELQRRDIPAFGPTAAGARIEGSKAFAKDVMEASGAPTGGYVATSNRAEAHVALDLFGGPYVVKADGLAGGKGVRICASRDEARDAVDDALVRGMFGEAGTRIVVEQFLLGPERSVFGVCDGDDVVLLAPAQDYKRVFDKDEGRNTGGMGAYTPVPDFRLADVHHLRELVFLPVLRELAARGAPYRGLLYAGLVDTIDGPQLLEFNARFGDPETQVILPQLASDLGELLHASAIGSVADLEVAWHDDAVVTVVLASGGYPEGYATGIPIHGVDDGVAGSLRGPVAHAPDVMVFHAGTVRAADGSLVTAGGRVLDVTARGVDVAEARARAYAAADRITWQGQHRRNDIAARR